MTRAFALIWPVACGLFVALLCAGAWREAAVGTILAECEVVLAVFLLRRAISSSHEDFLKIFFVVFGSQGLLFVLLSALAWRGVLGTVPVLATYAAGVVGGTLACGLGLKPHRASGAR